MSEWQTNEYRMRTGANGCSTHRLILCLIGRSFRERTFVDWYRNTGDGQVPAYTDEFDEMMIAQAASTLEDRIDR